MSKSSTSKTTEIKKKNEVVSDDLPFIAASGDYENLKITPPKRWFNVSVALLVALIGSCVGAIIGIVVLHFAK